MTNSGNVTLDPVVVTDAMPGLSPIDCPDTSLAPAQAETCTATYTTTQADVDAGGVTNAGTATGTPPSGPPVSDEASVTVPAAASPGIGIVKSPSISGFSGPDQLVTYTYAVTNTGNVTLDPVDVTDPVVGLSGIDCPDTSLAPGQEEDCTATYTTTQADVDAGGVTNTGTATGVPPSGPDVAAQSTVTLPATQSPAILLVKSASVPSFSAPGVVVTYHYQVTNTGNVTLDPVTVTDPQPGLSAVTCPEMSLVPGGQEICTASYVITQADVDAGGISNTGTASGTPPSGPPVTDSSPLTVAATQSPAISLAKTASIASFDQTDVLITYTYVVTNGGNVTLTLTSPVIADPLPGLSTVSCPITDGGPATLAPGDETTCTATYTTTQADVDAGGITNVATATATDPADQPVTSPPASLTIPAVALPAITVTKTASPTDFTAAGQTVTYSYLVTNTGNVTLDPVTVTDPMVGLSPISCPETSLPPAAPSGVDGADGAASPINEETCTATYITTTADVTAGEITNTGTATGTAGPTTVNATSTAVVPFAGLSLKKSADVTTFSTAGTVVHYTYLVTNRGDEDLTSVAVTDPMPGLSAIACPSMTLAVGASESCTASYTITQADVDRGNVANTGTANAQDPNDMPVTPAQSSLTIPGTQSPALTLTKVASISTFSAAGTPVIYDYVVINTGNVTLTSVTVTDPMPGLSPVTCPTTVLAPGASVTCTAAYITTAADVAAGKISNVGTASASPPGGQGPVTSTSTVVVPVSSPTPIPTPTPAPPSPVIPEPVAVTG